MILHLGVVDLPYVKAQVGPAQQLGAASTGDVATILEAKYSVMQTFFILHEQDVATAMEKSMAGALENLLLGAPAAPNLFMAAESDIDKQFRKFIASGEIETAGIDGVPTQAALDGVNHRKKKPRTGKRRVSFRDTGLYMNSFKAWVD